MTPEERLRRAIAARARSVEPSDDGFDRITEKLLDPGGDMKVSLTSTTRWYLVAAAAVVLAGIAGVITLVSNDGDDTGAVGDQSNPTVTLDPTTRPSTTTTTTSTSTLPEGSQINQVLWPRPSSTVRFDDPVAAANSFARFYLGLKDPVIGEFGQGDTRSGEVEVRAAPDRPFIITVSVRQLEDDNWYAIASSTENIDVTSPVIEDTLSCPVRLQGTALAFEGTVQIRIDAYQPDGKRVEVARGHVTGSGSPPAGPFDEQISCRVPDGVEPYGILTAYTTDESEQVDGMIEAHTQYIRLR